MTHRILSFALAVTVVLSGGSLSFAQEAKPDVPATVGGMQSTPKSKQAIAERRKANAKIKPVNINSATAQQLKKLPGIGDAEAARIIAGRPYGSKLWLVTNNIIPEGYYLEIKHLIVAGQSSKEADKGATPNQKKP